MDHLFNAAIAGLMSLNIVSASTPDLNNNPEATKPEVLGISQPVKTESLFEEKFATVSAEIKFETEYKDDPETEAGIETTVQEGKDGKKVTTTKITFYNGEEFDKDIVDVKVEKPVN